MKIRITGMLCIVALVISSCGKEPSFEQDTDPPPVVDTPQVDTDTIPLAENGGLLKRMVTKYDGEEDSLVLTLQYDSKNRLLEISGLHEGPVDDIEDIQKYLEQYTWNSKGFVEKIKQVIYTYGDYSSTANHEPQLFWEADYEIHFDESTSHYSYTILTGTGEGNPFKDSLVYRYNGSKIEQFLDYTIPFNLNEYVLGDSLGYTYDGKGNIIEKTGTNRDYPDGRKPSAHYIMEYDDKLNPVSMGNEALLVGYEVSFLPTPNNIKKHTDLLYNEYNYSINYTYNMHDKPTVAVVKNDDGETQIHRYYYLK
jgi:hypothetical protein